MNTEIDIYFEECKCALNEIETQARQQIVFVLLKLFPDADYSGRHVRLPSPSVHIQPGHDRNLVFDMGSGLWKDLSTDKGGSTLCGFYSYQSGLGLIEAGTIISNHVMSALKQQAKLEALARGENA